MNSLKGKVAIVTGASKGIGAEIARSMAAAGAQVAINYATDANAAEDVLADIRDRGGKAIAVQGDVSVGADAARVVAEAAAAFGGVHVLVNNAAFFRFDPLEAITEELFHRHFNVNVLGPILMTQAALPHFRANACVINIGSAAVLSAGTNATLYASTKAALDMLTQVWSKELGGRGVRVNSIWPGVTDTGGTRRTAAWDDDMMQRIKEKTALERAGRPTDIAPAVVFLASDDAAWVTGAVLNVSGGFR